MHVFYSDLDMFGNKVNFHAYYMFLILSNFYLGLLDKAFFLPW